MADARKVSVLIIGGGPIGLAVAVELAWRGIPCELIEQTDGSIKTPKMNEVNTRTMEFCRRWGVADAVINCPFPKDYPQDVVFVTNLAGYELARAHRPSRANAEPEFYGPMRRQACSQIWFDPILRNFAASQPGVTLRYRHRLESFEQTPSGVIAEIVSLESNSRERLFAEYLVACDGANSAVRDQLGIGLAGKGTLGYPAHLFFRAPGLLKSCGKDPGTFFFVLDKGGLWANLRVTDPANDTWRLMVLETDGKQTPESLDRESMLRRVVGWNGSARRYGRAAVWSPSAIQRTGYFWPAMPYTNCHRPARSA